MTGCGLDDRDSIHSTFSSLGSKGARADAKKREFYLSTRDFTFGLSYICMIFLNALNTRICKFQVKEFVSQNRKFV